MKHVNKSLTEEQIEYIDISGTRKENPIVSTRGKGLYSVVEFTKWGEVNTFFIVKVRGKLSGSFTDINHAIASYNSK